MKTRIFTASAAYISATNSKSITTSSNTNSQRATQTKMIQNFHLVWLDSSIDERNDNYCNSITKLRQVVNTVNTFVDVDECIDLITDIKERCFVIISEELSEFIIAILQNIYQVSWVYIFRKDNVQYEKWAEQLSKVAGVYTDIAPIYEALKEATRDCSRNSITISFAEKIDGTANQSLYTLEPSFMYTQILKEILLTIDFDEGHRKDFFTYCRQRYAGNNDDLKKVEKIEKEYCPQRSIWWYTYERFFYSMLNRALRTMDQVDLVIDMGFFVRDLHNNIAQLHYIQYGRNSHSDSFTVYRGQGLSQTDFNKLKNSRGGLLAFNNFLSTSLNPQVSRAFAESATDNSDFIGVDFRITINPSISSTSFSNIGNISNIPDEEEILFSMHSVFRIGQVKQIEKNNNRLWQVELTLTDDNDPQLQEVTKNMQEDTKGPTGWFRLGLLMMKVAQFDKAQQLFEMILDRSTDEEEKGNLYYFLGWIKTNQGKNTEAITYCDKSLEIRQKSLPLNNPDLAASYHNIGLLHDNTGEYSKALSYYEKALEIFETVLPANHRCLATSYNNIGGVYDDMGDYSKALSYYEKAFGIRKETLPANHPDLANSYNNIGLVYKNMGEYSKALSCYEKTLEIKERTLPANHPDLAISYNNIGLVCDNMSEYSKALSYYEKALGIRQKTLSTNHPDLAASYHNIGLLHDNTGEYSKALSYYEKALGIRERTPLGNPRLLATSYNNIGNVYDNMSEYSKALSYYEKAHEIFEKTLPESHPCLATSYSNIGLAYKRMGGYSKGLSYYEKALEIYQKALPESHSDLANCYNNIGMLYYNMGEYLKGLSYLERALNIWQRSLSPNHPFIKDVKRGIEIVKKKCK